MKDYHDLFLLLQSKGLIDSKKLKETLIKTFHNRGTTLSSIQFDADGYKLLQKLWIAHLNGLGSIAQELNMPHDIEALIGEINLSLDSIRSK